MSGRLKTCVCAAALLAGLGAPAALAQETFRVRAGEHADFTRLVIDGPVGGDYDWGVDGRRLVVVLRAEGATFDPAQAQAAPALSRIDEISAQPTESGAALVVDMTCDCGARSMSLGDGRFVIDLSRNAPRPEAPGLARTPGPESVQAAPATETAAATASPAAPPALRPPAPRPAAWAASASQTEGSTENAAGPDKGAESQIAMAARRASEPAPSEPAPTKVAPPETAPVVEATDSERREAPPSPGAKAAHGEHAAASAAPSADPGPATADATAPAADEDSREPTEAATAETAREAEEPGPDQAVIANARRQLLEQLTRAAEEGFLTFAPDADPPAQDPQAGDASEDGGEPQVSAKTALEIGSERGGKHRTKDEQPANCLPDNRLDAALWTQDAAVDLEFGKTRRALVKEFDSPDPRAVIAYAQLLVRYGFGYEARAALDAFADTVAPPPYLLDIAAVVDGDAPDPDGPLRQGVGCQGLHGAWALAGAALAGELDPAVIDPTALNDPLTRLPPLLRTVIAVPIAEAALDAGLIETASHVVTLAARSDPPQPDGDARLIILSARVDAARGDWRRAEAAIESLLDDASPAGAEAMIRMVEFRLARRSAPPPGLAENMEAMAFSLGSEPLGRRLLAAAAQARAKGEGLALALSALEDLSERGAAPGAAAAAARDMVVDYAPAAEESVAYAEAILDHLDLIGDGPDSDRARIAAARRFTELGVGGLAEDLLAPPLSRNEPAARLAAAEAALDSMAPDRALAYLDGAAGVAAARLRAAAYAARRDYASAVAEAAAAEDVTLEARYAWLAGDWRAAAAAGDADRRVLAAWMAGAGEMPPELRDAAETDPDLAARLDAFDPGGAPVPAGEPLKAAADALEAARRRRAVMTELIGDG